jgi:hypothetical protein
MLVVSHHPNSASGGRVSETGVDVFLSHDGRGPERQALVEALASLGSDSSPKAAEQMSRALGQAVAQCWSSLPQEIQHNLFEAAAEEAGPPRHNIRGGQENKRAHLDFPIAATSQARDRA